MSTITTRAGKGSPLTNAEVDANFTNLDADKLEKSGGTMTGTLTLAGDPSSDLDAVPKQYADAIQALALAAI
jgi:hypothetical protein